MVDLYLIAGLSLIIVLNPRWMFLSAMLPYDDLLQELFDTWSLSCSSSEFDRSVMQVQIETAQLCIHFIIHFQNFKFF